MTDPGRNAIKLLPYEKLFVGWDMETYRAYFLDRDGHIRRPAEVLNVNDDAAAVARIDALSEQDTTHAAIELWHGKRLVVRRDIQRMAG